MKIELLVLGIIAVIAIAGFIDFSISEITGEAGYTPSTFRFASWDCADSSHHESTGCKTYHEWSNEAKEVCKQHCIRDSRNIERCNPNNLRVRENCSKIERAEIICPTIIKFRVV